MSPKCSACGHENEESITSFDVENTFCNHEALYLLQCEKCRGFFLSAWEDDWTSGKEYQYDLGSVPAEKAELIYLFFMSCENYKTCKCEIHQAVRSWQGFTNQTIPLVERADLIEKIKADPRYPEWQKEWARVVLPPAGG